MPTRPANTRRPSAPPSALLSACLTALALALPACSGGPPAAPARQAPPAQTLADRYAIVVVEPVAISADLAKRHAQAARICQKSALDALAADGRFALVHHTMPDAPAHPVLVVKSRITDMRLRDGGRRSEASPAEDYIHLYVWLVDADTRAVLREKQLSTAQADEGKKRRDPAHTLGALLAAYVLDAAP